MNTTLKIFADNLSAKTAARLLKKLRMGVSADTLLRLLKQEVPRPVTAPRAIGVDDFAFRRGRSYGTLLIDLETHRPIDLLPDRSGDTLKTWLVEHPGVEIISRDRSTEYIRGATKGAPQALQVADRWHILKNLREALERVLNRVHSKLVSVQKATYKIQEADGQTKRWRTRQQAQESKIARLKRQRRYEEVVGLYKTGHSILEIAEELGMSRGTVGNFVHAGAFPERANILRTKSLLEPYLAYLESQWAAGKHNAKQLWREISEQGYAGGYKVVGRWAALKRERPGRLLSAREKAQVASQQAELKALEAERELVFEIAVEPVEEKEYTNIPLKPLAATHHLVWLLLRDKDTLNVEEQEVLAFICQEPDLERAYQLGQLFRKMVQERRGAELESWISACLNSGIRELINFAGGLQSEFSSIRAALTLSYSNGPTEGQVNRLKLIKRSLYGKGSFEILRRRVLQAA
jgi:transposase